MRSNYKSALAILLIGMALPYMVSFPALYKSMQHGNYLLLLKASLFIQLFNIMPCLIVVMAYFYSRWIGLSAAVFIYSYLVFAYISARESQSFAAVSNFFAAPIYASLLAIILICLLIFMQIAYGFIKKQRKV